MRVSVAICTWNRAELLDQTLQQMHRLSVPPGIDGEVVVVNDCFAIRIKEIESNRSRGSSA